MCLVLCLLQQGRQTEPAWSVRCSAGRRGGAGGCGGGSGQGGGSAAGDEGGRGAGPALAGRAGGCARRALKRAACKYRHCWPISDYFLAWMVCPALVRLLPRARLPPPLQVDLWVTPLGGGGAAPDSLQCSCACCLSHVCRRGRKCRYEPRAGGRTGGCARCALNRAARSRGRCWVAHEFLHYTESVLSRMWATRAYSQELWRLVGGSQNLEGVLALERTACCSRQCSLTSRRLDDMGDLLVLILRFVHTMCMP